MHEPGQSPEQLQEFSLISQLPFPQVAGGGEVGTGPTVGVTPGGRVGAGVGVSGTSIQHPKVP